MLKLRKSAFALVNLALVAAMMASMSSCTEEDVAEGMGVIAMGAGAIAIGAAAEASGHGYRHYSCEGGYRSVCHQWRDYWGGWHTECRDAWDSCMYRRWEDSAVAGDVSEELVSGSSADPFPQPLTAAQAANTDSVSEVDWGTTFNLGYDGSRQLIDALRKARQRDAQAIYGLGVSHEDMLAMAQYKMPSQQGVDALAKSLNQDVGSTRAMLQRILDIASAQRPAITSYVGDVPVGSAYDK